MFWKIKQSSAKSWPPKHLSLGTTAGYWRVLAKDSFFTLLRAIGLKIWTFISGGRQEVPKVYIRRSWVVVLAHCAVHIIPSAISLFLISWNFLGFFVGNDLDRGHDNAAKQGALQVAAKIQVMAKQILWS